MKRIVVALVGLVLALTLASPAQADDGQPAGGPGTPPTGQNEQPEQPAEPETPVWQGVPGTNQAHDLYGYAWPAAPDCDESNVGTGGCVNDGLGFFQGQCTSWVAHRLGQRNGIGFSNWYLGRHWGDARDWAAVAKSLKIKPNKIPATGAVGWYARGHVSYVESVNSDGSIVLSEMNIDGHNGFAVHTVYPGESGWPDKFIHLADVVPVDYTAPDRPGELAAAPAERGVQVTWKQPADDLGVTGYTVLRDGFPVADTTEPTYLDLQASPGQAYTYSVEAYDAAGNRSDAAETLLRQGTPAPARLAKLFLPDSAQLVQLDDRSLVCGRLGSMRKQHVGCAVRTRSGPQLVRTGREVPWGSAASQVFLAGADDRAWFCRSLPARGDSHACLPFDAQSRSWGYDRVDHARKALVRPTWVASAAGPARCGTLSDRATCSVLTVDGWTVPKRAGDARPGDPLSRAFVATDRGLGFCRVVDGRAACTELGGQGRWRTTVATGRQVAHGRWVARPAGPSLCPVGGGECRTVTRD